MMTLERRLLLTDGLSRYSSLFDALRRQGSPVQIRRGPATVMATKAAKQATVSPRLAGRRGK
jgi:hypothetical protein